MKILVTGSNGFIGSHLVNKLTELGHDVIMYDIGDKFPNEKVDLVYHLAANANAYESVKNPKLSLENIKITFKVLEWMRKTGSKNIIFTSSREAFSLVNPYGASKLACENMIEPYCKTFGFAAISARLANVSGKGNLSYRFIESTIDKARKNEDIVIYGEKVLNFINVKECVERLIMLQEFLTPKKNYVMEFANFTSYTLKYVARKIIELTNSKSKIVVKENRLGETLGYAPQESPFLIKTDIEEIIKRCL